MNTDKSLTTSILGPALATAAILLVPLMGMQFTEEVAWTLSDFFISGILLFSTGLTYKLITTKSTELPYRVAVGSAIASGLLLIWANLAVGVIGSEENPINLLYFAVIAIGFVRAFVVHFRPKGMILTMFTMAFAQALVAVIALAGGYYQSPHSTIMHILGINGFFITLFIISALLFRRAERRNSE